MENAVGMVADRGEAMGDVGFDLCFDHSDFLVFEIFGDDDDVAEVVGDDGGVGDVDEEDGEKGEAGDEEGGNAERGEERVEERVEEGDDDNATEAEEGEE